MFQRLVIQCASVNSCHAPLIDQPRTPGLLKCHLSKRLVSKWLAVLRIDEARRKAGVTIGKARETVKAFGLRRALDHYGDVFPNYTSDGG